MACCSLEEVRVNHSPQSLAPLSLSDLLFRGHRAASALQHQPESRKTQSNHTTIFVFDVIWVTINEDHRVRGERSLDSTTSVTAALD